MLDEFTQVTGSHRKAAIRLLNRLSSPGGNKRRGRPACVQGCKAIAYSHLGSQRSAMLKAVTAVPACDDQGAQGSR